MKRTAVLLVTLLWPGVLQAAKVPVAGRVVDARDKPVAGAKVLLLRILPRVEDGLLELEGKADPEPAATATSDAAGSFRIEAPEEGIWKVRVEARGFAPVQAALVPLVEETELPPARLVPDAGTRVTVMDPQGQPLAGARVWAEDGRFALGRQDPWTFPIRLATTGADGTAHLPRAAEESLTVRAGAAGSRMAESKGVRGTASLRLASGRLRGLQVRDPQGKAVAGALVWLEGWPYGRTSESGAIDLPLPDSGLAVRIATADGRETRLQVKPAAPEEKGKPAMAVLAAPGTVSGKVVSARDGRPIPGALAWLSTDWRTAKAGPDGVFRLSVPLAEEREPGASAAAPRFLQGEADRAGAGRSVTLSLQPKLAVSGVVVDESGRGLPGAALTATLLPGARVTDFSVYQSGGFFRSGEGGRFRLASLAPGVAYSLRAVLPGFAPVQMELPPREPGPPGPELRIVLPAGRTAYGLVVNGGRSPVAEAQAILKTAAATDMATRFRQARDPEAGRFAGATDAAGRFTLSHLPAGTYDLTVRRQGFAPITVPGLTIPEGKGTTDLGTVMLSPGAVLAGRVVDPQNRPIGGAEVRTSLPADRNMPRMLPGPPAGPPDALTGADGTFRLEDRSPGESVDLEVLHPDYGPGAAPGVAVPAPEPVRIVLQPTARVSGRTVGTDGKPVAGARVLLSEEVAASFGGHSALISGRRHLATSDGEGAFSFSGVAPGPIEIKAQAPRRQRAELKGLEAKPAQELAGLELVLPPAATLEGRVLSPEGRPVPGAQVGVAEPGENRMMASFLAALSAQTDGDGRYVLDGVPPGPRTVEARAEGYRRAARDLDVAPGANAVDFELERGFEVSGRVVDEGGQPVASVNLSLVAGRNFMDAPRATSGPDGAFRFTGVSEGTFRILARKAGYTSPGPDAAVTVTGASVGGLELKLSAGGSITGRLSGLEFRDLARVRVWAGWETNLGQVDAEGGYRIPNLQPGEWNVTAEVPGTPLHAEGRVTLEPGMAEARLDLQFGGGHTLTGIVLLNGRPLAGAGLNLIRTGGGGYRQALTDHQGTFRFGDLAAGTYDLVVSSSQGARRKQAVEISGDREIEVELRAVRLSGRVVDAVDSSPLRGVQIVLEPAEDELVIPTKTVTDSKGEFRLPEVADGDWKLAASREGYSPAEKAVRVEGADPGVEIALTPTEGLILEVILPNGQAPESIHAAVLDAAGNAVASGFYPVGESGRVRLPNVPPGSWQLLVDTDQAAPVIVAAAVPGPAVRAALPPAGTLRVRAPALSQDDDALIKLTLTNQGGVLYRAFEWNDRVTTEWDLGRGERLFTRIPAGSWKVTASAADGRSWTGTAAVAAGGVAEVVLE